MIQDDANLDFKERRAKRLPFVDQLQKVDFSILFRHVQVLIVQFHDILQTKKNF